MPPELKAKIEAEAKRNGRSMNTEVIARLAASLRDPVAYSVTATTAAYQHDITESEKQMLQVFRRMPPEKQLALLSLFK
jgi:hypothetical protein